LETVKILLPANGILPLFLSIALTFEIIILLLAFYSLPLSSLLVNFGKLINVAGAQKAFTTYVSSMILQELLLGDFFFSLLGL
jgi:hypothetical protein